MTAVRGCASVSWEEGSEEVELEEAMETLHPSTRPPAWSSCAMRVSACVCVCLYRRLYVSVCVCVCVCMCMSDDV